LPWLALAPLFGVAIVLILPFGPSIDGDGTQGYEIPFRWVTVEIIAELMAFQIACFAVGWLAKRLFSSRTS